MVLMTLWLLERPGRVERLMPEPLGMVLVTVWFGHVVPVPFDRFPLGPFGLAVPLGLFLGHGPAVAGAMEDELGSVRAVVPKVVLPEMVFMPIHGSP
jgi:hypothetical protein